MAAGDATIILVSHLDQHPAPCKHPPAVFATAAACPLPSPPPWLWSSQLVCNRRLAGRAAQDPLPRHPEVRSDVHARGCGLQPRPPAEAAGCRGVTISGGCPETAVRRSFGRVELRRLRFPPKNKPLQVSLAGKHSISEFFRSLLRSDTQAGPTRLCPPDRYDVSWMRVSQCNERWRTWEGSTARSQR
ncbi:MAG: hypothetical protein QOJ58_5458 [Alphaproteobacteria bacterium]|nr:hypothetical protein [Alphaproteobacteria bacterium]